MELSDNSGSGAVAEAPSSYNLFYNLNDNRTYTPTELQGAFGIDTQTVSIAVLNYQGFYPVVEAPITANTGLYGATASYAVDGEVANQSWTYSPLPLATAQANGTLQVQVTAAQEISDIILLSGYSAETLSAAGAMPEVDRPATYQTVIAEQQVVSDQLAVYVDQIANATEVDTINNIVSQPYGVINTGRGGPGQAGPLDLNLTYFTSISDLGFGQDALELYVPGTDTVIPYTNSLPLPFHFDSAGNCFNNGDWRLVIRMADSGAVISTITVPQGANQDVAWTYNPVIPAAPGGGSSSHRA
jgi:hypothetical protein